MFSKTYLVALAALPSALATISITQPIASTSWTAGQQQTIQWMDDGKTPSLQQFGASKVSIYAGNVNQQTELQQIVPSVDVSTTGSIAFTPDATIGPNGDVYFIRFESLGLKDATNPQFPAEAFSAKFTLTGMSGTFNSTVQQEVDAGSSASAPGAGASSTGAAAASNTGASAPSSPAATSSKASTSSSKSAAPSTTGATQANGARGLFTSAGLVGSVAAFLGAMML
ncbi:hypothetical protein PsYK624_024080 [Phanerochaete sordida]|uniref:Yeast cell wall synthesis Kre9/Knh1-like N-terminal domain-containing protein n=1 Tax=Phanerochaete sordida TaxID=48140 RepID=A0A9P3FZV2_9APHY|nr:hypothetical protein PsYK624_024080 [Phanerochaete sordida]